MGGSDPGTDKRRFGRYLRSVREQRKLSLDAVEEMSLGYPERVTKSHLSRIENGQAVPTFPRMFALSRIYGLPIASVAEKFEVDLDLEMQPADVADKSFPQIEADIDKLRMAGRYSEALSLVSAALERFNAAVDSTRGDDPVKELRLYEINCLIHLQRFESAKVECEELLNHEDLSDRQRLWALLAFVNCSQRLHRFTVAKMGLERVERELATHDHPPRARAVTESIRGPALFNMGCIQDASAAFEQALQLFRSLGDRFQACKAQVNLAQALIELGEPNKARAHLIRALRVADDSGYDKLKALALSHLVVVARRRGENDTAEAYALRSNAIARPRDYTSIVFRNCYYLREIAAERGDDASVRSNERTLKTFLSRVGSDLPEATLYRARLTGERP
jgi:tetratricopeptide (TPR) repeat protein